MPTKKKKPSKPNGFSVFMEIIREQRREVGLNIPMREMPQIAQPEWEKLSKEEKKVYDQMAKQARQNGSDNKYEGKYDSYGNPILQNIKEQEEAAECEEKMSLWIKDQLRSLSNVPREKFYFISTLVFCKTEEGEYFPAEIALVEYSIEDGICKTYQEFIDPGERTHQIPPPPQKFEKANGKYHEIVRSIFDMLQPRGKQLSPVFCSTDQIEATKYVLRWLQLKSGARHPIEIPVFDSAFLLLELMKFVPGEWTQCTIGIVRDYLANTCSYYGVKGVCCKWHSEVDRAYDCALSMAKCTAYVYANYLCEIYNITPLSKKHVPATSDVDSDSESLPSSRLSMGELKKALPALPPKARGSEASTLVRAKSRFDTEEPRYYVPSSASYVSSFTDRSLDHSNPPLSNTTGQRTIKPFRQPNADYSSVLLGNQEYSEKFVPNYDDFPALGSNQRSSAISDDARSLYSENSNYPESEVSIPGSQITWETSSLASVSSNSSKVPGRGFGRGRTVSRE